MTNFNDTIAEVLQHSSISMAASWGNFRVEMY
jgi:hypothetical protein